jgi:hypothetical protein
VLVSATRSGKVWNGRWIGLGRRWGRLELWLLPLRLNVHPVTHQHPSNADAICELYCLLLHSALAETCDTGCRWGLARSLGSGEGAGDALGHVVWGWDRGRWCLQRGQGRSGTHQHPSNVGLMPYSSLLASACTGCCQPHPRRLASHTTRHAFPDLVRALARPQRRPRRPRPIQRPLQTFPDLADRSSPLDTPSPTSFVPFYEPSDVPDHSSDHSKPHSSSVSPGTEFKQRTMC